MTAAGLVFHSGDEIILLTFIITIVVWNHLLIYTAATGGTSTHHDRARHSIVISFACCDIIVALFPLFLQLQGIYFEDEEFQAKLPCWKHYLSHVYLFFFAPFVKAAGLLLLTAESYLFWRPSTQDRSYKSLVIFPCTRLTLALAPWLLGSVVLIPLILSRYDFNECTVDFSVPTVLSFYLIAVVFPGLLVLFTATLYKFVCTSPGYVYGRLVSPPTNQKQTLTLHLHQNQVAMPETKCYKCGAYNELRSEFKTDSLEKHHQYLVSSTKTCANSPKTTSPATFLSEGSDIHVATLGEVNATQTAMKGEQWLLFADAVVFCVCCLPAAIMSIVVLLDNPDILLAGPTTIGVLEKLRRLHVLRSLFSPVLWFTYFK